VGDWGALRRGLARGKNIWGGGGDVRGYIRSQATERQLQFQYKIKQSWNFTDDFFICFSLGGA
jgi:hypothetical protein